VLKGPDPAETNTPLVNVKKVEDFHNMNDFLGKTKNLGQDSGLRPKDLVYGKTSGVKGLTAAEVIKGRYQAADLQPDRDLGKSITPGFRNLTFQVSFFHFVYSLQLIFNLFSFQTSFLFLPFPYFPIFLGSSLWCP
jgi:hypothetical protein